MLRPPLRFAFSLAVLLASPLSAAEPTPATSTSPSNATPAPVDPAPLRADFHAAFDRNDLPIAWFAARAWLDAAPHDPAAHLANAQLYLQLKAPAAALNSAGTGLSLLSTPAASASADSARLTRSLLAVKAQAHLAVNEPAPAWAAFTRLLTSSGPAATTITAATTVDPLVLIARHARWDAYVQLTATDSYARFFTRLSDAAAQPTAPASAHLELARWLQANNDSASARRIVRTALDAQPASRELQFGFVDLLFMQLLAAEDRDAGRTFAGEMGPDLQRLRAAPVADAFTLALIDDLLRQYFPSDTPERTEPRDPVAVAKTFLASLASRRDRLVAQCKPAADALLGFREADATAQPTPAALTAREPLLAQHHQTLSAAFAELDRLDSEHNALAQQLSSHLAKAAPADKPAIEATLKQLYALAETPPTQSDILYAARQALLSLPHRVTEYRQLARHLTARAAFATATTPAAVLAATDASLIAGDQAPFVWRKRFEAALAAQDLPEALASGARAVTAEIAEIADFGAALANPLPPATVALLDQLDKLAADAPRLVAEAVAAWEAGQPETALARLDRALALDPALPSAWLQRWRWSGSAGDHDTAVLALDRWWRLDDRSPIPFTEAFATAARSGAWELLRSLAEARLETHPTDTAAILFRAHAALALNQTKFASDLVSVLDHSADRSSALVLAHIAANLGSAAPRFDNHLVNLLGKPDTPPGLDLWLGYCLHRLRAQNTPDLEKIAHLPAIPASLHRDRFEGRLPPADYLARTRGTPDESTAALVSFLIASTTALPPEVQELGHRVSKEPTLPLALRAVAHRALVLGNHASVAPSLRASDLFHADQAPAPHAAGWCAPGQEIFIIGAFDANALSRNLPLRLRGAGRAAQASFSAAPRSNTTAPLRLVELRDLEMRGNGLSDFENRFLLEGRRVLLRQTSPTVNVAARFRDSRFDNNAFTVGPKARLHWHNVDASLVGPGIQGSWTTVGGDVRFNLPPRIEPTARLDHTRTVLTGHFPFTTPAGGEVVWRDLTASTSNPLPETFPTGWRLENVRWVAPPVAAGPAVRPLPAPHRGQHYAVAGTSAETTTKVTSLEQLTQTLAAAKPGDVIGLEPGEYRINAPLRLKPGVSLVGRPGARIGVFGMSTGAFTLDEPGAVRLRDLTVEHYDPTRTGTTYLPDKNDNTVFTLRPDTWLAVHGGKLERWFQETHHFAHLAPRTHLELFNFPWLDRVQLAPTASVYRFGLDYDPLRNFRHEIALRSREQLWRDAARRFEAELTRAPSLDERRRLVAGFSDTVAQIAFLTKADSPTASRALLQTLLPAVQRFPAETTQLYLSAGHYHTLHVPTHRELMPASLRASLNQYVAASREAFRIGLDKVSTDTVLSFRAAYPPGSPDYAAAQAALERGLTLARFQADQATAKKRATELAAALDARLKAQHAATAAALKRAAADSARYGSSYAGNSSSNSSPRYSGSNWSANTYTPRLAPAWTPSASQQMANYRHNLDVQIMSVTRRR